MYLAPSSFFATRVFGGGREDGEDQHGNWLSDQPPIVLTTFQSWMALDMADGITQ